MTENEKNSALPQNRRVRSTTFTVSGTDASLDVYVRGTLVNEED